MMTMRILRPARAALLPALLMAAASCVPSTEPVLGGEYLGSLDSPFNAEGAALLELTAADLREVSSPGRILVARGTTERTVRILVMNPPQNFSGGPITFRVRMADGAVPPAATVLQVSGPINQLRDFVGGYRVNFTRLDPEPSAQRAPLQQTGPVAPIPLARMVAPFFPGGLGLTPPEVIAVDGAAGNGNRVYDLGDLRGYLVQYPREIPPPFVWSR